MEICMIKYKFNLEYIVFFIYIRFCSLIIVIIFYIYIYTYIAVKFELKCLNIIFPALGAVGPRLEICISTSRNMSVYVSQ